MCIEHLIYTIDNLTSTLSQVITECHKTPTWDGWLTFAGTVSVSIVTAIITIYHYIDAKQKDKEKFFIIRLDKLIEISIQYPKLEYIEFTEKYEKCLNSEEYLRYDNYCCLIYDFIEQLWDFYGHNLIKMKNIVHFEEYLYTHRKWWVLNKEINKKMYNEKFSKMVDEEYKNYKTLIHGN